MTVKQKNDVFHTILKNSFDPNDFSISSDTIKGSYCTIITYKDSEFQFTIRNKHGSSDEFDFRYVKFAPDFPETTFMPENKFISFQKITNEFENWLVRQIKKYEAEKDEIDLWDEYVNGINIIEIGEIESIDTNFFNIDEQKQIQLSLNEIKYLIQQKFSTTIIQQENIDARLDYIAEASRRLNKFDWKSLVISTVIGIAINLTLDRERGRELYNLFRKLLGLVSGLIP